SSCSPGLDASASTIPHPGRRCHSRNAAPRDRLRAPLPRCDGRRGLLPGRRRPAEVRSCAQVFDDNKPRASDFREVGMTASRPCARLINNLAMLGGAAMILALAPMAIAQAPTGIPGVVAPGVEAELVQEGFTFTEGPVGAADGSLYFSDIRVSKTHHLDLS